jgi:hypothetical protein
MHQDFVGQLFDGREAFAITVILDADSGWQCQAIWCPVSLPKSNAWIDH